MEFYLYNNELFQFPVVVVIEKNSPRKAPDVEGLPDVVPELCNYKNNRMRVYTYDRNFMPVESDIQFKCFDTTCDIGKTVSDGKDAILDADFPQCVNGYIIAKADGYETQKYIVPDLEEKEVTIFLGKKYKLNLSVEKNREAIQDYSVITFTRNGSMITVSYPEQKEVELTEDMYQVKVFVYSNSSITLKGSTSEKCVDVPKSGFLGIFGAQEKKCFNLNIPDQLVSYAVSGGGTQNYYISESDLAQAKKIILNTGSFGVPQRIEDLKNNYDKVESSGLEVRFE